MRLEKDKPKATLLLLRLYLVFDFLIECFGDDLFARCFGEEGDDGCEYHRGCHTDNAYHGREADACAQSLAKRASVIKLIVAEENDKSRR